MAPMRYNKDRAKGVHGLTESSPINDGSRKSWIESANVPGNGFPLASLPWCTFSAENSRARPGIRIGDYVLDLQRLSRGGLFEGLPAEIPSACGTRTLNALAACGKASRTALRTRLTELLDTSADNATRDAVSAALIPVADATLHKPFEPANYTDFYASIDHATNVGRLFRPDQPLLPNYKFVPIGYHGRASSIVVSGTPIRRPHGQTRPASPDATPAFGPTHFLDYEVEAGFWIAGSNALGEPVPIDRAGQQIFGLSLVNDWSARDIQSWEYQPLGPFLAKNFSTSVSPWVLPIEALEPWRVPARLRIEDPSPLPYLWNATDQYTGAFDLTLEALLLTPAMRAAGEPAHRLSRANLRELYWTPAQLIAHHASNGCNLLPGDLVASGTVSGAAPDSAGCLLELTRGGAEPVLLPNGEKRSALEDGDEVILRGYCQRDGLPLISLGECRGTVLPAL